jgi:hypothetical protein
MEHSKLRTHISPFIRLAPVVCALVMACAAQPGGAQDVPLLSGGVGFFTATDGGSTFYQPHIEPLIAAPVGKSLLFESRAFIIEEFYPNGGGESGYSHFHLANFVYLQGDYLANPHFTIVGGSFLLPFNTYNDRLSEIWIQNFQDSPIIGSIGTLNTGIGVGGMLSGSAVSNDKFNLSYNAWYSTHSSYTNFDSERSSGGRASLYLPQSRLEVGVSFDRQLQGANEHFVGSHLWWEPADSEYGRGQHAQGYWAEADYRTKAFGGFDSWIGRFEPVFRMQQTFRINSQGSDGVPSVNTQRADFGFDYNLPHNTRILTSYARQFSSTQNENVWETGIVYRFLFPAWKGKM